MQKTTEQIAVLTAATDTSDNLIIEALAGAAKTTTLIMIAEALAPKQVLALAFNKAIAVELQDRLPSNCTAKTLNSIGHRAWADSIGRRVKLDKNKMYRLVKDATSMYSGSVGDQMKKAFFDLLRTANDLKAKGWVPNDHYKNATHLVDDEHVFASCEVILTPEEKDVMRVVMLDSINESFNGNIDFSDQIYMPTLFKATFEYFPVVLIDEAQDLSLLNHLMLKKIARKRLIAVGDRCQAIYGFRGASEKSMDNLQTLFSMTKYSLTTSFRCSQAVVAEAQWRAPAMVAPDFAQEGSVNKLLTWTLDDIKEHSAIICRNNAPLFRLAIKLLRHGVYPKLLGNDIGVALIKILKYLGPLHAKASEGIIELKEWRETKLRRQRNVATINDQYDSVFLFLEQADTIGGAIELVTQTINSSGSVYLMTGHKSKGLEFDTVYFLDQQLISDKGQDPNIKYVIQTRAKRDLNYIDLEGLIEEGV